MPYVSRAGSSLHQYQMLDILVFMTVIITPLLCAEDMTLSINANRKTHITSDKFLSITIDPAILFTSSDLGINRSQMLKIAQSLSPAYLRIAGSGTDHIKFNTNPSSSEMAENFTVTDIHWIALNEFAQEAGLELIVGLNILQRNGGAWDFTDCLDIISLSDKLGYNINWQLGYELQELEEKISPVRLGQDFYLLRNVLNAFHRYENSLLIGPDITRFKSREDIEFMHGYFHETENVIDAITWHPRFSKIQNVTNKALEKVNLQLENLNWHKDELVRFFRPSLKKKPLWIAESKDYQSQGMFLDALLWLQRLGNAARIGTEVVMKNPYRNSFFHPTPDYWVSLLYKMLVGQSVLDARVIGGDKSHTQLYAHCTNVIKHHKNNMMGGVNYQQGSVTVYGINLMDKNMTAMIKTANWGREGKEEIHEYIFTSPDSLQSRKILLNGIELKMEDEEDFPTLSPVVLPTGQSFHITMPPQSFGFWVISGVQLKPCMETVASSDKEMNRLQLPLYAKRIIQEKSEWKINEEKVSSEIINKIGSNSEVQYPNIMPSVSISRSENSTNLIMQNGKINISLIDEGVNDSTDEYVEREMRTVPHRLKRYSEREAGPYFIPGLNMDLYNPNIHEHRSKSHKKRKNEPEEIERERNHKRKKKTSRGGGGGREEMFGAPRYHVTMSDPNTYDSYEDTVYNMFNGQRDRDDSFPQGDVFLRTGIDSAEDTRNRDYVYVDTPEVPRRYPDYDFEDDNNYEDKQVTVDYSEKYFDGVGEFFEKAEKREVDPKLAALAELWEGDSIDFNDSDLPKEEDDDDAGEKIIQEKPPSEEEERKARDSALKMIESFYINSDDLNEVRGSHDDHKHHKHKHESNDHESKRTKRKKEAVADSIKESHPEFLGFGENEAEIKTDKIVKQKDKSQNNEQTNHKKDKENKNHKNHQERQKQKEINHMNQENSKKEKHSSHEHHTREKSKSNKISKYDSMEIESSEAREKRKEKRKHVSAEIVRQDKTDNSKTMKKDTETKKEKSSAKLITFDSEEELQLREDEMKNKKEKTKLERKAESQTNLKEDVRMSTKDKKKENMPKSDGKAITQKHSSEEYNMDTTDQVESGTSSQQLSTEYEESESEYIDTSAESEYNTEDSNGSSEQYNHNDNKVVKSHKEVSDTAKSNSKNKNHKAPNTTKSNRNRREAVEAINTDMYEYTSRPEYDNLSSTSSDGIYDLQDDSEYLEDYSDDSSNNTTEVDSEQTTKSIIYDNKAEPENNKQIDPLHIYNEYHSDRAGHDNVLVNIAKREDLTTSSFPSTTEVTAIDGNKTSNEKVTENYVNNNFPDKKTILQDNIDFLTQSMQASEYIYHLESKNSTSQQTTGKNVLGENPDTIMSDLNNFLKENVSIKDTEQLTSKPAENVNSDVYNNAFNKENSSSTNNIMAPLNNNKNDLLVSDNNFKIDDAITVENIRRYIPEDRNLVLSTDSDQARKNIKRDSPASVDQVENILQSSHTAENLNENVSTSNPKQEVIDPEMKDKSLPKENVQSFGIETKNEESMQEKRETMLNTETILNRDPNMHLHDSVLESERESVGPFSKRENTLSDITDNQMTSGNNAPSNDHQKQMTADHSDSQHIDTVTSGREEHKPKPVSMKEKEEELIQEAINSLLEPLKENDKLQSKANNEMVPSVDTTSSTVATPTTSTTTAAPTTTAATTVTNPTVKPTKMTLQERRKQRLLLAKKRYQSRAEQKTKKKVTPNQETATATKQRREAIPKWNEADDHRYLINQNHLRSPDLAERSDEIFMERELLREHVPYDTQYITSLQSFSDFVHKNHYPSDSVHNQHNIINRHIRNQNPYPYTQNIIQPREESILLYRKQPDVKHDYSSSLNSILRFGKQMPTYSKYNFIPEPKLQSSQRNNGINSSDSTSITGLGSGEEFWALHVTKTTMRPLQSSQVELFETNVIPSPNTNHHYLTGQKDYHIWHHNPNSEINDGRNPHSDKYKKGYVYPKNIYEDAMLDMNQELEDHNNEFILPTFMIHKPDNIEDNWDDDAGFEDLIREARYSPVKLKNEVFPFDEMGKDTVTEFDYITDSKGNRNSLYKSPSETKHSFFDLDDDDDFMFPTNGHKLFTLDDNNDDAVIVDDDKFNDFNTDLLFNFQNSLENNDGMLMLVPFNENHQIRITPRLRRSVSYFNTDLDSIIDQHDDKMAAKDKEIKSDVPLENDMNDNIQHEKTKHILVEVPEKLESLWMDEELDLSRLNHNKNKIKHAEKVNSGNIIKNNFKNNKISLDSNDEMLNDINTDNLSESDERRIKYKHKLYKWNKKFKKYQEDIMKNKDLYDEKLDVKQYEKEKQVENNMTSNSISSTRENEEMSEEKVRKGKNESVASEVENNMLEQPLNNTKDAVNVGNENQGGFLKVHIFSFPKRTYSRGIFWHSLPQLKIDENFHNSDVTTSERTEEGYDKTASREQMTPNTVQETTQNVYVHNIPYTNLYSHEPQPVSIFSRLFRSVRSFMSSFVQRLGM